MLVQVPVGPPVLSLFPGWGAEHRGVLRWYQTLNVLCPSASVTPEALPSAELLEASEAKQCHLANYLNNALGLN